MENFGRQNQGACASQQSCNTKTTIYYDDVEIIVKVKANKNATYLERMIYLYDDEKSYQYVYFYGPITQINEHTSKWAKVQDSPIKESRKIWRNYKRLFDKTIEMMEDNFDYESDSEEYDFY